MVNQKDSQHPDCLMIKSALTASDLRIKENKPLNIGFILGVFCGLSIGITFLKSREKINAESCAL